MTYRICTHCVMDTSDPEIGFDAAGRCSHCAHYARRAANELFTGEEARRRLDAAVKVMQRAGRGKAYDCIEGKAIRPWEV